jgi:ABC-type proline/glycine betaine transport system permease subunit
VVVAEFVAVTAEPVGVCQALAVVGLGASPLVPVVALEAYSLLPIIRESSHKDLRRIKTYTVQVKLNDPT